MAEKEGEDTIHLKVKSQVVLCLSQGQRRGILQNKADDAAGEADAEVLRATGGTLIVTRSRTSRMCVSFTTESGCWRRTRRMMYTPGLSQLNMQSGDEIDVVVEQVGGAGNIARFRDFSGSLDREREPQCLH